MIIGVETIFWSSKSNTLWTRTCFLTTYQEVTYMSGCTRTVPSWDAFLLFAGLGVCSSLVVGADLFLAFREFSMSLNTKSWYSSTSQLCTEDCHITRERFWWETLQKCSRTEKEVCQILHNSSSSRLPCIYCVLVKGEDCCLGKVANTRSCHYHKV